MPANEPKPITTQVTLLSGEITLEIIPPDEFKLEPTVEFNGSEATIQETNGEPMKKTWRYNALIKVGKTTITCKLGNAEATVEIEAKPAQTINQDFIFGKNR